MLVSPSLDIYSVTVGDVSNNTLFTSFKTVTKEKNVETQAMINCGAGRAFIDQNVEQKKLDHPLTAKNADGTINKKGTIKKYVDLEFKIDSRKFKEQFYVTGLGKQKIILGFSGLKNIIQKLTGKLERLNGRNIFSLFNSYLEREKQTQNP